MAISGSGISLDGGISVEPGGAIANTIALIDSYDVANFWALNQSNVVLFGNRGRRPVATVPFVVAPDSADSTPMAAEPLTTATAFDGADECVEIAAAPAIPYTLATNVVFVRAASFVAQVLWAHGTAAGTIESRLQTGIDSFLVVLGNAAGARYVCTLTLPANIVLNVWHMIAWRQAVDGNGVDFFFDGTFFANASAEVANAFDGAGDVDFSFNNANTGGANRFAIASQADTGLSSKLTGDMIHSIIDDKVWTNTQLADLWDLALANGLNA